MLPSIQAKCRPPRIPGLDHQRLTHIAECPLVSPRYEFVSALHRMPGAYGATGRRTVSDPRSHATAQQSSGSRNPALRSEERISARAPSDPTAATT